MFEYIILLSKLFASFFQTGLFSIGGGYAMIPLIQRNIVEINGWMTVQEIADIVAISQMTPGPFAVNSATVVGIKVAGYLGAVVATLGVIAPSFIIVLIVSRFFFKFNQTKAVQGTMWGIRPVVAGLIFTATISMAATAFLPNGAIALNALFSSIDWISVALFAVVMVLMLKFKKITPIAWIVLAAGAGIVLGQTGIIM